LTEQLAANVVVSDQEVRDEYFKQNGRAIAQYVGVQLTTLTLENEPLESEIAAYYNAHLDEYMEPERVVVETVSWPKEASTLDIDDVRELAEDVRREILSGELDFAEAAAIYSEDNSREEGGDLGRFNRDRMVDAFTEAAFSLNVGELSEPVLTSFGYHVIEILEQFEVDGVVDEVHARHILFKIEASEETLSDLYANAELFRESALDVGFKEAAADAAVEVSEAAAIKPGRDLPNLRETLQATNFAFAADTGAVSRIFENEDVFYAVHVLETLPEAPAELTAVRSRVLSALNHERKLAAANEKLNPAIGALQMNRSFEDVAAEFDLEYAMTDTFSISGNITGIGYNTDFNAEVLANDIGTLVEHIETNRGVYAMSPVWKSEFDEEDYLAKREELYMRLLQQKQYDEITAWFEARTAEAEIEDNRDFLYAGS
jgi:peptidyl-prolyl cis-trans isomerase D